MSDEVFRDEEINYFPWIIWFMWKARNDKVFNGLDRKPQEILKHAIGEAQAWERAQLRGDEANNGLQSSHPTCPNMFGPI